MKVRVGFVSNSSSSSFLILWKNKVPQTMDDMCREFFGKPEAECADELNREERLYEHCEPQNIRFVLEAILNHLNKEKPTQKKAWEISSDGHVYHSLKERYPFVHTRAGVKQMFKENEGKITIDEFCDDSGSLWAFVEHDEDLWRSVAHAKRSNH